MPPAPRPLKRCASPMLCDHEFEALFLQRKLRKRANSHILSIVKNERRKRRISRSETRRADSLTVGQAPPCDTHWCHSSALFVDPRSCRDVPATARHVLPALVCSNDTAGHRAVGIKAKPVETGLRQQFAHPPIRKRLYGYAC